MLRSTFDLLKEPMRFDFFQISLSYKENVFLLLNHLICLFKHFEKFYVNNIYNEWWPKPKLVWNNMRVSNRWQIIHLEVNQPFKKWSSCKIRSQADVLGCSSFCPLSLLSLCGLVCLARWLCMALHVWVSWLHKVLPTFFHFQSCNICSEGSRLALHPDLTALFVFVFVVLVFCPSPIPCPVFV